MIILIPVQILRSGEVIILQQVINESDLQLDLTGEQVLSSAQIREETFQDFTSEQTFVVVNEATFQKVYKYYELIDLTLEDLAEKEKFLTDYHVLRYLEKETWTDRVTIGRLAVALSNLMRFCSAQDVQEFHYMSLRFVKKYSELLGKDIFFITEY